MCGKSISRILLQIQLHLKIRKFKPAFPLRKMRKARQISSLAERHGGARKSVDSHSQGTDENVPLEKKAHFWSCLS
jgi:hypothetical protein